MLFFGEFHYKLDEKGRLPVPPHFRGPLQEGIVFAPGIDGCIDAYSNKAWEVFSSGIAAASTSPSKLRKLKRTMFGQAFPASIDGQGRISLPEPLRTYAGIKTEAVVVGVSDHLEIWSKFAWDKEKADDQDQVWQIMEGLEKR
ncbi:division/cell wall cluster transcriptional repressor MraZ [Dehalogenimonas etheniformans]|uniref:Transcriptional regulator MraZ n=1 Tax=Dehalogenimonas etheniformans TaxID=1536648 RepID=A0A2P5P7S5_9CHLR|nr:division/cell wall cluster transcriptional repressor MraZ [Dehalogenimonas etheniformans]PPD58358.1 division/cell wall cluster transcriptional repressor MraZ [Dehalogenimonas etheniformans]QNT76931.1 division/cell wall cluster transcriptional repressor MraZ [Dehalogenimonas etheniformans]